MKLEKLHTLFASITAAIPLTTCAQHVHVQLSYAAANQWRLFIHDFESGDFDPAEVPLFTGHQAFSFVPANSFTNFLGPAGGGIWTLPETENSNLLYLGIGTQGIAPGTFVNNQIRLHLRGVSGPGHFALYNVDPFGTPIVHMSSRDGIQPTADSPALSAIGGHVHVNWAFSAPGTYQIQLGASGVLSSSGQTTTSPAVDYTFNVQDIPWRPRLGIAPSTNPTNFLITVEGEPGRNCRIEATSDFTHWETVTNFIPTGIVTTIPVPGLPNAPRFFRATIAAP